MFNIGDRVIVHGHPLSPTGIIEAVSPHHEDGYYVNYGVPVESPGMGYSMNGSNWDSKLLTLVTETEGLKDYLELFE